MANNRLVDLPRLIAQKEYEDATGVVTDERVVGKHAKSVEAVSASCNITQ